MTEPEDFSDLVAHYQVLCTAISFFEPMHWHHPVIQQWLTHHSLDHCKTPWQLPPAALWIMIQSLERKLTDLQTNTQIAKIKAHGSR
jgi:hypothetical protein